MYQESERRAPQSLIQDCPVPVRKGSTNGALATHNQELRAALDSCNDDKAALREWDRGGTVGN